MNKTLTNIKREVIFGLGNIRREHCLGGFAWGKFEHLISIEEAKKMVARAKPGYIGLHRNRGDLSNTGIKGCFKHAWLHVEDDMIIEAVSEGVLHRDALYPLIESDYAVILKPAISKVARAEACRRGHTIEGCLYDEGFEFEWTRPDKYFADKKTAEANMKKYCKFSCTEAVGFCLAGNRRKLGLFRVEVMNKQVIMPDNYMKVTFEIVAMSKSLTPEIANELGLHEEGVTMIEEFIGRRKL